MPTLLELMGEKKEETLPESPATGSLAELSGFAPTGETGTLADLTGQPPAPSPAGDIQAQLQEKYGLEDILGRLPRTTPEQPITEPPPQPATLVKKVTEAWKTGYKGVDVSMMMHQASIGQIPYE
ncbi:unnamed protein product, partial [marine sediment metagenome]